MITFVVVNYNGRNRIRKCLESILTQSYRKYKIIVIDNASTDNSLEVVKDLADSYSRIEIIKNKENLGFAKAANQGIVASSTKFVALVNNDAFLDKIWAEEMIKAAKDIRAGIFASKIYFMDGRINSVGHVIYRGFAIMERGFLEEDGGQYNEPCYVAGACAAAAMYRRSMLNDVGLFDEDYFMYNEDVDLSLRAILRGWKVLYVPTAVAYHMHSASTGFLSGFSIYYNSRNWVWSVLKNVPRDDLIKELPFFIFRNISSIMFFCLMGEYSIIQSKVDALKALKKTLKKREKIQNKLRFTKFKEYENGSGWSVLKNIWKLQINKKQKTKFY